MGGRLAVPADATGPGACGKSQWLKRYDTVYAGYHDRAAAAIIEIKVFINGAMPVF